MGSTVRTSRKQQSFGDNYTDPATGKIRSSWTDYYNINIMTATADYAPFNDRNLYQNNAIQTRLSWLGKERDKESGLGDHGVRKYDNISGRFLSIDPLWEKYLSWTPYQYAGNNPVNAYDVDGREPFHHSEKGSYSDLGLPQKQQQILLGGLGILGGVFGTIYSGGALAVVGTTGLTGSALATEVTLFTSSIFSVSASTAQVACQMADKPEAADKIPSSLGGVSGMVVDASLGNKDRTFQKAGDALVSGISLGRTATTKPNWLAKSPAMSIDFLSIFNNLPVEFNGYLKDDGKLLDYKSKSMENRSDRTFRVGFRGE